MIVRVLRRLLSADVLGLLLVGVALQALTSGIASSLRGTDTTYLFQVCLIAALTGYGLSKIRLHSFWASVVMAAIGILGIWIVGARLANPLLDWLRTVFALTPQIVPAIREKIIIDTSAVSEAWSVILQASSALAMRWQSWFLGINKNVTVNDPLIRSMIWTLLMWLLAAWIGWYAQRRSAIMALLPTLFLLSVVLSYSERRVETLWLIVFVLLLLMGIWNYKNHTTQWERRKVDYSDSIRYDNTQAVLLLAISIGVLAFITPSISWRQIRDFLRERNNRNQTAEMLGIQEQPVAPKKTAAQKPALPREHLLTEGFAQSQEIVMTIRTGELPPVPDLGLTAHAPRYYWRSTIYDRYVGAGWVVSATFPQSYQANTPLIPGLLNGYRQLHTDVEIFQPEGRLFWSGLLYSADVPFRADWRVRPQSSLFAGQTALLEADVFHVASSATSYEADMFIPTVTVEQLRSASTNYPEEISERYLDLPSELPERVPQLAREITKEYASPYDKAKAIENYLRTNYPYDLEVPAPPEDQDVADYFLFDLKKGYCDYYATAMVVLARASGLPARFVSGYASGSYDAPNAEYVVRELNAHSWPEIYFPEIGWIEFEPTGAQPEIERPEEEDEVLVSGEPVTPISRLLFQLTSTRFLYLISPLAMALLLVILYFTVIERFIFLHLTPLRAIEILYRRYYRAGRVLAGKRTRAETAYEFTDKLVQRAAEIHQDTKAKESLHKLQADVWHLTHIYYSTLFSHHAVNRNDSKIVLNIWKRLRWSLFVMKVKYWLWNRNKAMHQSY